MHHHCENQNITIEGRKKVDTSKYHLFLHIEDSCSEEEEVFFIHVVKSPASQPALVTCTINERHKVTFEIDTGASCNVLPLADYIKATGDKRGALLNPTKTRLMMHNNTSATPVGKVMLHVERSGNTHLLCFLVMKSAVTPILGKSSSIGMKLVKILDCDIVHSVNSDTLISRDSQVNRLGDPILSQYLDVFNGLGELPGEYTIQIRPNWVPIVNPPRRLPVSLRNVVKTELDMMIDKQIIAPVTELGIKHGGCSKKRRQSSYMLGPTTPK